MNILFFTRLYAPHIGGVEKHVANLSRELIKKNHQVTILTERFNPALPWHELNHGVNIYRIPLSNSSRQNKKWIIWKWIWQNKSLLKNADIIHIHDVFYWWLPFKLLFPFKKVFITFHGYEGINPPRRLVILQRKLGEWLSSGTVCVGDFMRTWYLARPKLVIYGAVKPIKPTNSKSLRAIYLGRLSQDSGIMVYLQALKILNVKNFPLGLDVFGDGPQLTEARKYAIAHNLDVNFKGMVINAEQKLPNYRYAFVSRYLAILEAMLAKIPVIAVYNNQIKYDYLTCHPQIKNMFLASKPQEVAKAVMVNTKIARQQKNKLDSSYNWAKAQTWQKLAGQYISLYTNSSKT